MRQNITSNWNFMRIIRLLLGIAIIVQAIVMKDWAVGILGIIFSSLPIFNIGCCGSRACNVASKKTSEIVRDVTYDEVT